MSHDPPDRDPEQLLPLKPQDLQVLLTLSERPLHAYGIAKAVDEERRGTVRLQIGSLYRMLARMLTAGLIEEVDDDGATGGDDADAAGQGSDPAGPGARRRTYRITGFGRRVAGAEARRLRAVVEIARERRILPDTAGA